MGSQFKPRTDFAVPDPDGRSGFINNQKCSTYMSEQTKSTLSLVGENALTDKEESISSANKAIMLGSTTNHHWKGYPERSNSEVHQLYKRQRSRICRERGTISELEEEPDKKRRDNGDDSCREEMQ